MSLLNHDNSHWMTPPPPVYDATSAFSTSGLRPYLELSHLYSLAWLAYPILSLLFIAFRLLISSASSQDAVASAKDNLLASCLAAEKSATAAASMPRYMALATNEQISDAVNGTLNGARATLILSLTMMEGIINFIIDLYRSTFLCFLELVIRGGLAILISAVEEITNFIESTLSGLRTTIQAEVGNVNGAIKSAIDGINQINPFADIPVPSFDIPSLNSLQNVQIPTDFEDALRKLNSTLPTFQDIKEKIESVIDTPFELLKKDINDTFANLTFDVKGMPVPKQNSVVFCNQLDTSVVDDLGNDFIKMTKIGIAILVALALILFLGNCAVEWYKWRCLHANMQYTREAWTTDPTLVHPTQVAGQAPVVALTDHNQMLLHNAAAHPLMTRLANQFSKLFHLSPTAHTNLRWFFSYVFHPPALACFLIGFFGILSVQIQLIAVHPLAEKYSARGAEAIRDFSGTIAQGVNTSMYAQSAEYAAAMNSRIAEIQTTLDGGVFGWLNETTVHLNTTLNEFYSEIQGAVDTVFKGTILEQPAQEFIRCFIGSKVDALENALTFLHDNVQVQMPKVNESALVLSQSSVDEATRPIALAAVGGSGDGDEDDGGLVGKLVAKYVASLEKERIMFAIFLGLWGFVVLMALSIIAWHTWMGPFVHERKRRRWQRKHDENVAEFAIARSAASSTEGFADEKAGALRPSFEEESKLGLRSFTPLPQSPKATGFFHNLGARKDNGRPPLNANESSDSFFDHSESSPAATHNKLVTLGRKAFGREPASRDVESAETARALAEETPAWTKRLTSLWRREDPAGHISPFLVPDPLPAPVTYGGWGSTVDVDDGSDGPLSRQASANPYAMPVPLYHTWESPTSAGLTTPPLRSALAAKQVTSPVYTLLPPAPAPRRVRIEEPSTTMNSTETPVAAKYMAAYHTRESSNPFATPFDDERARAV